MTYQIRTAHEEEFDVLAIFEREISLISFKDKAITDLSFHKKKLVKSKDKSGMFVLVSNDDKILGWMWMDIKKTV